MGIMSPWRGLNVFAHDHPERHARGNYEYRESYRSFGSTNLVQTRQQNCFGHVANLRSRHVKVDQK